MHNIVQYKTEEAINRVDIGKRAGKNLIIHMHTNRQIDTEEAMRQDGPTVKIIQAIDQYNPKHIRVEIRTPMDKADIPYYTIEFKEFFDLPTDTTYLQNKITKALRELLL